MLAYRGSPRVDEALELLTINDYQTLLKTKSKLIRGQLTWANVCAVAANGVAPRLLEGDLDRAMDACEDAHTLAERLKERDRHVNARVTAALRQRIGQLEALAACLEVAARLREGEAIDDLDALGRLLALRTRWFALRRDTQSHADSAWVVELVQAAAGRVLTSGASAAAKGLASKAVAAWVVPAPADASPSTPPHTPPHTPPEAPPPAKRMMRHDGGEQLTWDDDDLF